MAEDARETKGEIFDKDQLKIIQDFFSKRAIAFASFFMASFFALFTTLKLIYDAGDLATTKIALSFTYWTVWTMGVYCLLCFSYYASFAHEAEWKIANTAQTEIFKHFRTLHKFPLGWFYDYKYGLEHARYKWLDKFKKKMIYLYGAIYFGISLLSWIVIFFRF